MSLEQKCPVFQFSVKGDERGSMIVIEGGIDIPFDIKRMFYIYGSDTSVIRGQHANRESEFILINVHGTSKVKLRDGEEERIVVLDTPMKGVYIPRMVWKDMYDFSEDSVIKGHYNPTDAIIYEISVRDMTTYPKTDIINKGKYLGLCQEKDSNGYKLDCGISHIIDLGVTHVQLMPIFDFSFSLFQVSL